MIAHSLSVKLLEYGIFILILAHLKKIPNEFYRVLPFARHHDFIGMPFVCNVKTFTMQLIRVLLSELLTPFPN